MNVMILCAGEGRRLRPFTEQMPKPAIPFLSAPLAYYSLALLDHIEIDNLVINTHHLPDQVENIFRDIPAKWKNLRFSSEKEKLLGSGGGIHFAKSHLIGRGDFLVMNGDEVILPHQLGMIKEMMDFHQWHGGIATLLTIDHTEVGKKFGGAWTVSGETRVQCFSKTRPSEGNFKGHHFIGAMVLSEKIFSYFKKEMVDENILYETLTLAMQTNEQVHIFNTQAEWFETGNPEDFMKATEFCLQSLKDKAVLAHYWLDHLNQTVRLYSKDKYLIESNWAHLDELKRVVHAIKMGDL